MGFNITEKLVVAVASSALFDLTESDKIFREKGASYYKRYTRQHQNDVFQPGVAFPFVRRLLMINKKFGEYQHCGQRAKVVYCKTPFPLY